MAKSKEKMFKVGEIVGSVTLKNAFDAYVFRVLVGHIDYQERKRGEKRKYKIVKALPTREEYLKLKRQMYATTVEQLVTDATAEIEGLKDELQNWYDNLPENFQNGTKGDELQEAISTLESFSEPNVCGAAKEIATVYYPPMNGSSRSDRLDDAIGMLREAQESIESHIDEAKDAAEKAGGEFDASELEDSVSEIEQAADELEGNVNFPGMF